MNIVDPGHVYSLDLLDDAKDGHSYHLVFVKREGLKYPRNVGHHPGTTSQEVLRALIDRTEYVNHQMPCAESEAAVGLLKAVLLLFELRAARCHSRFLDVPLDAVVAGVGKCPTCGHVGCRTTTQRK